jgi:DNA-binding MarR family transcriptional regulator
MRDGLAERGFEPFRPGDGAWVRILAAQPCTIGEVAELIGISRQAATKAADSLERRGYATRVLDGDDRRRVILVLTDLGAGYAGAIADVVSEIDADVVANVDPDDLDAAYRVLAAVTS